MSAEPGFRLLAKVVEITTSAAEIDERLEGVLAELNQHFALRYSTILRYNNQGALRQISDCSVIAASARPPKGNTARSLHFSSDLGFLGKTIRQRTPLMVTSEQALRDPALVQLCQPGEGAALLPVFDGNSLYGVLLLALEGGRNLDDEQWPLLQVVSRTIALNLRDFQVYADAKRRIAELNMLSDLGRQAIVSSDLDSLLRKVATMAAQLLLAECALVVIDYSPSEITPRCAFYCRNGKDCKTVRTCREYGMSLLTPPVQEPSPCPVHKKQGKPLRTPIHFKGPYHGMLCVMGKQGQPEQANFSAEDLHSLRNLASMAGPTLNNAISFLELETMARRNKKMADDLRALLETGQALMTSDDFEHRLLITLGAVVHPQGLAYERAVFFSFDEENASFRPRAELAKNQLSDGDLPANLAQFALASYPPPGVRASALKNMEEAVKREPAFLRSLFDAFSMMIYERKSAVVDDPARHPGLSPELKELAGGDPFILLPVSARERLVGVLLVLQKRQPEKAELNLLEMLANLAGLAMDGARLYRNLQSVNRELAQMQTRLLEADRLAALGAVINGVAHEIRTPLVSIGGFARRLAKKTENDPARNAYLDIIISEVTRLEKVLREMLDISTDTGQFFGEHNLAVLLDRALRLLSQELAESRITVLRQYDPQLPPAVCDEQQVTKVFLHILSNGIQAMQGQVNRVMTIRTRLMDRDEHLFAVAEISDTGPGMSLEVLHNIFNPFFTTKPTAKGLGLSTAHKIITRQYGWIEPCGQDGGGTAFLIGLPIFTKSKAEVTELCQTE